MAKKVKRDSNEVESLVANGMSVNKACAKAGLQNTVYYFRKRKDQALERQKEYLSINNTHKMAISDDINDLMQEYRSTEERLSQIKMKIGESFMSNS